MKTLPSAMPHTPLLSHLRSAASVVRESTARQVEVERVFAERALTRREFVRRAGIATAALAAGPLAFAGKAAGSSARVVIVGGGLAGLTCAYRLKQAGVAATIYEANTRLGGRC